MLHAMRRASQTVDDMHITYMPHRHKIQSGVWNGPLVGYHETQSYTISRAIRFWYENISNGEESVTFRDKCSGLHCSKSCPEQIVLEVEERENAWPMGVKIGVVAVVLFIAVMCLLMKVSCYTTYMNIVCCSHYSNI